MGKATKNGKRTRRGEARRKVEVERAVDAPVLTGVSLSLTQRVRLKEAEALAAGDWRDRQKAAHLVREVERQLATAREAAATEAAVAHALARARARGEDVVVEDAVQADWRRDERGVTVRVKGQPILDSKTVRRARHVDGLVSLHRAGGLSDAQKRTGEVYRAWWQAAQPPVTSGLNEPSGRGFAGSDGMVWAGIERGKACAWLSHVHREVGADRARVLQAVAGMGQTLRSMGDGGHAKAANQRRLRDSLIAIPLIDWNAFWESFDRAAR